MARSEFTAGPAGKRTAKTRFMRDEVSGSAASRAALRFWTNEHPWSLWSRSGIERSKSELEAAFSEEPAIDAAAKKAVQSSARRRMFVRGRERRDIVVVMGIIARTRRIEAVRVWCGRGLYFSI